MYKQALDLLINAVTTTLIFSLALGVGWSLMRSITVALQNAAINFIC